MRISVLRGRDELLERILGDGPLLRTLWGLTAVMVASAALYGAALGSWHGFRLAVYDAVKLPTVLVLTSAFTMLFSWIAARLSGVSLRFAQVAALTFLGLATGAVVLASLTPIAWFFTFCAPSPSGAARATHNALYLMHTSCVAACGVAGSRTLWFAMLRLPHPRSLVMGVYALWVLAYAIVGGEVAWMLRPFVGSVSPVHPLVFLRHDAMTGNVYEFIVTDILPFLLSGSES
ncbi:MAG: hypothetical protein U0Q12_14400 [Vicinamibacterales bacterium]